MDEKENIKNNIRENLQKSVRTSAAVKMPKDDRKKKLWRGILIIAAIAAVTAAAWIFVGTPIINFLKESDKFRAWVDAQGAAAPLLFGLAVIFQVIIALIPGEPFEIAAGFAFGSHWGSIWCMLFSGLGSIMVFLLVKKYGRRLVNLFFDDTQLDKIKFLKTSPKRNYLFLIIFMIPGTPKDLLSYFAGLTDLPFPVWALICTLGRIPSIVTSTIGGNAIGDKRYAAAITVFAVTLAISAAGILAYNSICKKHNSQ